MSSTVHAIIPDRADRFIRMRQAGPTCDSRIGAERDACWVAEGCEAYSASVEAEGELVDSALRNLGTQPVINALFPHLEPREHGW